MEDPIRLTVEGYERKIEALKTENNSLRVQIQELKLELIKKDDALSYCIKDMWNSGRIGGRDYDED